MSTPRPPLDGLASAAHASVIAPGASNGDPGKTRAICGIELRTLVSEAVIAGINEDLLFGRSRFGEETLPLRLADVLVSRRLNHAERNRRHGADDVPRSERRFVGVMFGDPG